MKLVLENSHGRADSFFNTVEKQYANQELLKGCDIYQCNKKRSYKKCIISVKYCNFTPLVVSGRRNKP